MNSEDIAERFWSLAHKPDEEARREQLFLDDVIHKAHVQREIESRLAGVETALDVGGGTGRFSLWLASRGVRVTHVDISPGMIERARRDALHAGLEEMLTFRQGRLADMATYAPGEFDLVVCSDAPLSYAYPDHAAMLASLIHVCARTIVLSVSSRPAYVALAINPTQKEAYFADPHSDDPLVRFYRQSGRARLTNWQPELQLARKALDSGLMTSAEDIAHEYQAGRAPWPQNYLFRPEELAALLAANRVTDIRLSGPGALSRGLPNEVLRTLLLNERYREEFLDLCFKFDSQPSVCGMGKDNLVASGQVTPGS